MSSRQNWSAPPLTALETLSQLQFRRQRAHAAMGVLEKFKVLKFWIGKGIMG